VTALYSLSLIDSISTSDINLNRSGRTDAGVNAISAYITLFIKSRNVKCIIDEKEDQENADSKDKDEFNYIAMLSNELSKKEVKGISILS